MPKRQCESDMENPEEFAAWAFAAGIPDPRGERFGFQPLIPAPCFPAVSKMLWDFGFRHHADLQTKWVPEFAGPGRNFTALGLTDEPDSVLQAATEMLVDQFPDVASKLASVTPENRDDVVKEQANTLLESLAKLQEAADKLAAVPTPAAGESEGVAQ